MSSVERQSRWLLENGESMGDPDDCRDQGNCEMRQDPRTAHLAVIARATTSC